MHRFDAIISDVDGCLQPESHAPLDGPALERVAAHNRRAHEPGSGLPHVTLCTGRPQPYAEAICRLIANTSLPIVAEMGVWLWHPDTNRFDRDPSITAEHLANLDRCRRYIEADLFPRGFVTQPGKTCSISVYHDDTPTLKAIEPGLRERAESEGWGLRVSSTWHWINLDLAHVSKATGIERMKAHAGLESARLAGIGDTMSDLAIREQVAFFACPSNADERLKGHADYVSPLAEIAGVIDIIERISGMTDQEGKP